MSSLSRYKKAGGFFQLLSLIETFGPAKKEKFLEMIQGESAPWAHALRDKMLTLERIFSWPDQVVVEVVKRLPAKSQAFAMTGLKEEQKAKVIQFYSSSEQRRLDDVLSESQPKPEEVQATLFKLVELARKMIQERELNPEKFDTGLSIPEDFESKIEAMYALGAIGSAGGGGMSAVAGAQPAQAASVGPEITAPTPNPNAGAEVYQLQRTLATVLKENKGLKDEVRNLQTRLEQIRKIA